MTVVANKIYKDQHYAIYFDIETSTTGITNNRVRVKDPSGTVTYLSSSSTGAEEIYAFMPGASNNASGRWELRAWPIYGAVDANPVPGTPVYVDVYEP